MKDNPAMVAGLVRASIKGWKEVFANPTGAVDTLMKIAPTLDRAHQEFSIQENKRLLTAGLAPKQGLLWLDMTAIRSAHDIFLASKVINSPVDLDKAFSLTALQSIPLSERLS
jgi:NitT/TauT family transport system substrate-binding protein